MRKVILFTLLLSLLFTGSYQVLATPYDFDNDSEIDILTRDNDTGIVYCALEEAEQTTTGIPLEFNCPEAVDVMVSEDATFTNSALGDTSWLTIPASRNFPLSAGQGTKILYSKFKNTQGFTADGIPVTIITDYTSPQITITSPNDRENFTYTPITVTGTINEPCYKASVNSVEATLVNDTYNVDISLTEGNNTLTAAAVDLCGNIGNASLNVTRDLGAVISGQITDSVTGEPLSGCFVIAWEINIDDWLGQYFTGADGRYEFINLPAGDYRVGVMEPDAYHAVQFYNNQQFWFEADIVNYDGTSDLTFDFALLQAGAVTGTVIDAVTSLPVANASVAATNPVSFLTCFTETDLNGNFTIDSMPQGDYIIQVNTPSSTYALEYYDNKYYWDDADSVTVTNLQTLNLANTIELDAGGSISGSAQELLADQSTTPITSDLFLEIWDAAELKIINSTGINPDGSYEIYNLPYGDYKVKAFSFGTYLEEFYADKYIYENADIITLANSTPNVTNIDFTLDTPENSELEITDYFWTSEYINASHNTIWFSAVAERYSSFHFTIKDSANTTVQDETTDYSYLEYYANWDGQGWADGDYTWTLQAEDSLGITSDLLTGTIYLDTLPPQNPSISIDEGETTAVRAINLTLNADSATYMKITEGDINDPALEWIPYTTAYPFNLSRQNGEKIISVIFRDDANNLSYVVTDTITLNRIVDITTPQDGVTIYDENITVQGTINFTPPFTVTVNGVIATIDNDSFSAAITLTEGENTIQAIATDDLSQEIGADSINVTYDSAPYLSNINITPLNFNPNGDGIADEIFIQADINRESNWEISITNTTLGEVKNITGTGTQINTSWTGDGADSNYPDYTITINATSLGGTPSAPYVQYIVYDIIPPNILYLPEIIEGKFINNSSINVRVNASGDPRYVSFSLDNSNWSDWISYEEIVPYDLPSIDGDYQLYAKLRDEAGNLSDERASNKVFIDTQEPTNLSIQINDGETETNNPHVTLHLAADGAVYYAISLDGTNYSDWFIAETEKDWYLGEYDGLKTVYLKAKDLCGNESVAIASADITINSGDVTPTLKQLTTGENGVIDLNPQFNSDGTEIYFTSNRGSSEGLWKVSVLGGDPVEVIADISYAADYEISADENSLLYYQLDGVLRCYINSPINDYSTRTRITDDTFTNDYSPCFNTDATKVYFIGRKNGQNDIWEKDLSSGDFTQITNDEAMEEDLDYAATANKLVYVKRQKIRVLDLNTMEEETLEIGNSPCISDDGTKILFEKEEQIYLYDEENEFKQLTQNGVNVQPVLNVDNDKIAFVSKRANNVYIWLKEIVTPQLTINNEDNSTIDPTVTLSLNVPGAVKMAFANEDGNFSELENYATEKQWQLRSFEGERTVFGLFVGEDEEVIDLIDDSIDLDLPPQELKIIINSNNAYTHDTNLTLTTIGQDIENVSFSEDNTTWSSYQAYQKNIIYTLSNSSLGETIVYFKSEDINHQEAQPVFDKIILSNGTELKEIKTIYNPDNTITLNAKAVNINQEGITGVEYFIDSIGSDGTGVSMTAVDGTFDSDEEDVTATISGITPGAERIIYLHAKNSSNNWGGCIAFKLHPSAESLLYIVGENYKKIKDLQGTYVTKLWADDELLKEETFSLKKTFPYMVRIDNLTENVSMISNGYTLYYEDNIFSGGEEFTDLSEFGGRFKAEEIFFNINNFIETHNLTVTDTPEVLGVGKWEITATPKEEQSRVYESLTIILDLNNKGFEKEEYYFGAEAAIGNKTVEYQNITQIADIYYPMQIVKIEDYPGQGIIKYEMTWSSVLFNQGIPESEFEIPTQS